MAEFDSFSNKMVNDCRNITFLCPKCLKKKISRSFKARSLGSEYKCDNCGFVGP